MSAENVTLERNPAADNVDWAELHTLLVSSFAYMTDRVDPPSSMLKMSVEDLRHKARFETLILARHGNDIVGCLFARDDGGSLYVGKVAVDGKYRGQGIARRLFKAAFSLAREKGAFAVELQTRVELTENHETFAKLGFRKVGETAHAGYDHPTSITMRCPLD